MVVAERALKLNCNDVPKRAIRGAANVFKARRPRIIIVIVMAEVLTAKLNYFPGKVYCLELLAWLGYDKQKVETFRNFCLKKLFKGWTRNNCNLDNF